jgi:hypothetical protein
MTGRLASGRAGLRRRARRGLTLALPLTLLALAAAAFAVAPSSISHRASAGPDQGLLPPTPRASVPAQGTYGRFAVAPAAVSGGERALSRPRRADQRRRVGP